MNSPQRIDASVRYLNALVAALTDTISHVDYDAHNQEQVAFDVRTAMMALYENMLKSPRSNSDIGCISIGISGQGIFHQADLKVGKLVIDERAKFLINRRATEDGTPFNDALEATIVTALNQHFAGK